jgi:Ca-activated chloride channel family protein
MFLRSSARILALFALLLSFPSASILRTFSQTSRSTASAKTPDNVVFSTTVINKKGELVTGLQRNDFQISVDNKAANIIDFREEDLPLNVGIVFDTSASIAGNPRQSSAKAIREVIQSVQQALKGFLKMSNPENEYFLITFSDTSQLVLDWTSDSEALIGTLGGARPKGNTAFYDACYLAIDKVQRGHHSKRALILISDGQDNVSTHSFVDVRDKLRTSDVLVYSVSFSRPDLMPTESKQDGQEISKQFSLVSGGRAFYKSSAKPAEVVAMFEMIARELRHQYTIALAPNIPSDDRKWHRIRIELDATANARDEMKQLSARTREGFYLNR